jgi:hypothetical protein
VKLDDWSATLALFETEYALPLLPPQLAACLATGLELGGSVLLLLGLGTRLPRWPSWNDRRSRGSCTQAWPTHPVAGFPAAVARGPDACRSTRCCPLAACSAFIGRRRGFLARPRMR